MTLAFNVVDY